MVKIINRIREFKIMTKTILFRYLIINDRLKLQ